MALTAAALAIGYATSTLLRKSVTIAAPALSNEFHLSKEDLGLVNTCFAVACGASKFVGALLIAPPASDRVFAVGLLLTALLNVVFAACNHVFSFSLVWFLAGIVHGLSLPALTHVVPRRYPTATLGRVWSVVITAGNVGYLVGPFLLLPLLTRYGWQGPVMGSGCAGLVVSVAVAAVLWGSKGAGDEAEAIPVSKDAVPQQQQQQEQQQLIFAQARNPSFWLIIIANCLTVFLLNGMASWTGLFLMEAHHASPARAAEMMLWNEVGGLAGSLACGAVSDVLGGRRCLAALLFACVCLPGYWAFPLPPDPLTFVAHHIYTYDARLRFALLAMGFGINGPKTLLCIAVRDVVPKEAVGVAGGVLGLVGQVRLIHTISSP